jgi:hypothetical protein
MKKSFLLVALMGAFCLSGFANNYEVAKMFTPETRHKLLFLSAVFSIPAIIFAIILIENFFKKHRIGFRLSGKKLLVFATTLLFTTNFT